MPQFTFSKPHFCQNSHFPNLIFNKIHIFQTSNSREFLDKMLVFAAVCRPETYRRLKTPLHPNAKSQYYRLLRDSSTFRDTLVFVWKVCSLTWQQRADKYSTTVKCNNDWNWNHKYFQLLVFKFSNFLCLVSLKWSSIPRNDKERLCVRPHVRYWFLGDGWADHDETLYV